MTTQEQLANLHRLKEVAQKKIASLRREAEAVGNARDVILGALSREYERLGRDQDAALSELEEIDKEITGLMPKHTANPVPTGPPRDCS
ncbi:MAG TPA: hypothetical protein VJJ22_02255 [Candidatus Paceibacterota bacterium]